MTTLASNDIVKYIVNIDETVIFKILAKKTKLVEN